MKRVLVLDACQRSALAVTRSLGKQGVPLVTADETQTALAGCSRFSGRYVRYPSPQVQPEHFIASVAGLIEKMGIQVILPMTELTTTLLLSHRNRFPDTILPFPNKNTVDSLADKCTLMRLAESLAVPIPHTWYADNPGKLSVNLQDLTYPVVFKPGRSWLKSNGDWIHTTVRFAESASDAEATLRSDPAFGAYPFLIQDYVSGNGQGVFALYDTGKPVAFFAHRRLREKPPRGGVSVLSESIPIKPLLLSHARSLLDKAGWHGIAMVEFKVNEDGTPYLMEINTRFWGSLQLAVDAGVDFPWMLYQLACGVQVDPVKEYRTERRLRWILGDLDSLYLLLRSSAYSLPEKVQAILRFLWPAPFRTRHEVNRWEDLGPFWWELKQYIADLIGKKN